MKKTVSKLLALAMAASLVLSGCGGSGNSGNSEETTGASESEESTSASSENEIKDLVIPRLASRELETFNILYTQRAEDGENLTSLVDGLLESNPKGELVPCIAEEWGTEDGGLTWTFKLREGVKWVDVNGQEKADCVAQDFATGLEWVLNFYKNDSSNTAMPIEMIKGAKEYYEYTKTLSEEEAKALTAGEGSKFREMVGLETPDDYTVIYHCITEKPYFDSLASYVALYPMAQGMVDELGGADAVRSMNNETMWYNGCYTMTSYIQGNEKIFTKNPMYWDTEAKLFDTVTVKMVESNDVAFQLYQTGDVDYVQLGEAQVNTIAKDANNEYHDYLVPDVPSHFSYQMQFNYNKNKEDGTPDTNWNTAIANEAFRLSWYYGLDFTNYWKRVNAINPMSCENNFYTMKGLVYTSDGTDYTDLVRKEVGMTDENGTTPIRLDAEKAEQYKQQAIEELTAAGVTFPVEVDYYVSASNQTAQDSANVLSQVFTDSLGDDYVKLNIKTYVSSATQEVYTPRLHSVTVGSGWGADYGDPQNYLIQEAYGYDNAYYSAKYTNINSVEENENTKALLDTYKEFTRLIEEADAIVDDIDARYEAFAEAEAYMIQHALVIPQYYGTGWVLTKINPYSKMYAVYGCQNDKMKNWETNADGYTTEEMEAIKAAYEAEK